MVRCAFCGRSAEESFAPDLRIQRLLRSFNKSYRGGLLCKKCHYLATNRLKIDDVKKGKENQSNNAESNSPNISKIFGGNSRDSHEERGDSLETHRCSQVSRIFSQPSQEPLPIISMPLPLESILSTSIQSGSDEASNISSSLTSDLEIYTPREDEPLQKRRRIENKDEEGEGFAVEIANDKIKNRQTEKIVILEEFSDDVVCPDTIQKGNSNEEVPAPNIDDNNAIRSEPISITSPMPKQRRLREMDLHVLQRDLNNRDIPNSNEFSRSSGG